MSDVGSRPMYVPVTHALHSLAGALEASTSAVNTIMQFVESYAAKVAHIESKVRTEEVSDLTAWAARLRAEDGGNLDAVSTEKIIAAWLEQRAIVQVNQSAHAARVLEGLFGSLRVLVTDSTILGALKAKLGAPPAPPAADEGKN